MCDQLGVFLQVVPPDMEIIPPSENVKTFGHDPHLKKRKEYLEYLMDMHTEDDDELPNDNKNDDDDGSSLYPDDQENVWQ